MKDQILMIVFVVVMGIIASAILVGTDSYTAGTIADNEEYALKSTILTAFGIEYTEDEVLDVYEANISEEEKNGTIFYYSSDGSVGYEFAGGGLWGTIEGFIVLESDLMTIKGIQILAQEETPGLGGVVAEQWYLDKFTGKQFDPEIIISKSADESTNTEVDAITGATMTSNFFQIMLNASYEENKEVLSQ